MKHPNQQGKGGRLSSVVYFYFVDLSLSPLSTPYSLSLSLSHTHTHTHTHTLIDLSSLFSLSLLSPSNLSGKFTLVHYLVQQLLTLTPDSLNAGDDLYASQDAAKFTIGQLQGVRFARYSKEFILSQYSYQKFHLSWFFSLF